MRIQFRNFLIKPMLALAIAIPAMMAGNVGTAEAGNKHHKRAAIIAGAIIGGAIIYNHNKRNRYHRRAHRGHYYGGRQYRSGYRYGHRNRYGHRSGHRHHRVYRNHRHGNYYGGYRQRWHGR